MKTGAILVAAGLSSRMHDFKPMLPFADSTISRNNIKILRSLGVDPVIVVTGYRADELEEHLKGSGVRFVRNERYRETGMFDSVKLGIAGIAGECDRILIMPMDIPAILPETYGLVLKEEAPIVRTRCRGESGHPVIISRDIALEVLDYGGECGLKGALESRSCGIEEFEVEDEGVLHDVDTPEEYSRLLEWSRQRTDR